MGVDSTGFGFVVIDGKKYEHDVIVDWKGHVKEFELRHRHYISRPEFKELAQLGPEIIVIGTGQYGECEVSEIFLEEAKNKGIEVIIKDTKMAIKEFNAIVKEFKRVVAFIHVTC